MDGPSTDPDVIFKLAGITIASTLGAAYIGILVATIFYGITCCQTLNYFRSYKSRGDSRYLWCLVACLWILDSMHQAAVFHVGYHYLIVGYGRPLVLFTVVWSLSTEWILNFLIGAMVQTFFVFRIWKFSRNLWITTFTGLCTIVALGVGLVYPIKIYMFPETLVAEEKFQSLSVSGSSATLVCDVIIAATIAFYLHRSRTGFRRSDGIITRLMILTVAAGGLTAAVWLANLIALVVAPTKLYDLLFNPSLSKLYTNSLLTMLNTRGFAAGVDTYGVERGDIQLEFGSIPSVNSSANPGTDLQPAFPPLILTASRAAEKADTAGFGAHQQGSKGKVTKSRHDIEFSKYV